MARKHRSSKSHELTRRGFIGVALTPLVLKLSACSSTPPTGGTGGSSGSGGTGGSPGTDPITAGAVLLGLYDGDGANALRQAVKRLDFSWLRPGDSVLIKVACNSQYTHPTTTSPRGVSAFVAELKARGAGRVIVADQSGVEWVRNSALGRFGATRDCFNQNGMIAVTNAGAEVYFFDEQPFDTGYFPATLPSGHHWPRGMYLPTIVREVDHIVYMPRIGTHVLAGNTLGHKSAIGWLRDDSRHDLHNDAQFFYEKYTEINYTKEIRDRFRMAITVSEQLLLHGGPDVGTPYVMSPVLVHASTSLANHDCLGASVLNTLNAQYTTVSPGTQTYSGSIAPTLNTFFANGTGVGTGAAGAWVSGSSQTVYTAHAWEQGITNDRAIGRGWELSGARPSSIQIVGDGAALASAVRGGIVTHGEGLYTFA